MITISSIEAQISDSIKKRNIYMKNITNCNKQQKSHRNSSAISRKKASELKRKLTQLRKQIKTYEIRSVRDRARGAYWRRQAVLTKQQISKLEKEYKQHMRNSTGFIQKAENYKKRGIYFQNLVKSVNAKITSLKAKLTVIKNKTFVGNSRSLEIHHKGCRWEKRIASRNRFTFSQAQLSHYLKKLKYDGCSYCFPEEHYK